MAGLRTGAADLGIVGFGAFGRLAGRHLAPHYRVLCFDPALDPGPVDGVPGVTAASLAEVAACPIVVLAMPVEQLEPTLERVAPFLTVGSLVLDVCSVKSGPARLMRDKIPASVDVVATHPLFGPQSARDGIAGLKIAICPVRGRRLRSVERFLRRTLRLQVITTTPEEHDREAATVQGLTHLIAKVLCQMEPLPTAMTTRSFDLLVGAVDMVRHDPPDVFHAIEKSNPFAAEARERFFGLAAALRRSLSDGPRPPHEPTLDGENP